MQVGQGETCKQPLGTEGNTALGISVIEVIESGLKTEKEGKVLL